jgi:hypothetical protein
LAAATPVIGHAFLLRLDAAHKSIAWAAASSIQRGPPEKLL